MRLVMNTTDAGNQTQYFWLEAKLPKFSGQGLELEARKE